MSEFTCSVVRVEIEPHPNADKIEIAKVGLFQSIVQKGKFKTGDLAVYIPEQAVLPEWLLKKMGFWNETQQKGQLAGSAGNRVKAIKLRGVLSQGILLDGTQGEDEHDDTRMHILSVLNEETRTVYDFLTGQDASEFLGIVKYEPKLPAHFAGNMIKPQGKDLDATISYDFDNIKRHPGMFQEGDLVQITEKIHGTFMMVGFLPERMQDERYCHGRIVVSSKGLAKRGFILDHNDQNNIYVKTARAYGLLDPVDSYHTQYLWELVRSYDKPLFILGEVFGEGVQDLTYGSSGVQFRVFDMCLGTRGQEAWINPSLVQTLCEQADLQYVPVLYEGKFSWEILKELTDGPEQVTGTSQIREGVVVKTWIDQSYHGMRKIAKSVSEAYLLRKSPNATEYA